MTGGAQREQNWSIGQRRPWRRSCQRKRAESTLGSLTLLTSVALRDDRWPRRRARSVLWRHRRVWPDHHSERTELAVLRSACSVARARDVVSPQRDLPPLAGKRRAPRRRTGWRVLPAVAAAQRHTASRHHLRADPQSITGWLEAHGRLPEGPGLIGATSTGRTSPILLEQARDTQMRTFPRIPAERGRFRGDVTNVTGSAIAVQVDARYAA